MIADNFYRPRSRGDNTFGSVHLSMCLFVCGSIRRERRDIACQCLWANNPPYTTFKMVVVSTGYAIAVDHAFNLDVVRHPQ